MGIFSIFFVFFGFLIGPIISWSGEHEVTSALRGVTLYPDRALVARELQVTIGKGEQMIKVTGLPAVLMDESIQAAIQGTSPYGSVISKWKRPI